MRKSSKQFVWPILVAGAHCSGTQELSSLLRYLGFFGGKVESMNRPQNVFQESNIYMLERMEATWDYPEPFIEQAGIFPEKCLYGLVEYIPSIFGVKFNHFVGNTFLNTVVMPTWMKIPWGWEDPLNTLTFPFWRCIFPEAKIIYIKRNLVDAATDLYADRVKTVVESSCEVSANKNSAGETVRRCDTFEGAYILTEIYNHYAEYFIEDLRKEELLELEYEELEKYPIAVLKNVCDFCELDASEDLIKKAGDLLVSDQV